MGKEKMEWEYWVLDAAGQATARDAPLAPVLGVPRSTAPAREWMQKVGDIDGDGHLEYVTAFDGAIRWYRPATLEKGLISIPNGYTSVGLVLEDIDGDGLPEIVTGVKESVIVTRKPGLNQYVYDTCDESLWQLCWFDQPSAGNEEWHKHSITDAHRGHPHDIVFADLDGDGRRELVAGSMYCYLPGHYFYVPGADPREPWSKHIIQEGLSGDGTVVGDFCSRGVVEIVSGPYRFTPPAAGPLSGSWRVSPFAADFREMCRAATVDITGTSMQDIVIAESEYPDCRMSWFENPSNEDPSSPWKEHPLPGKLAFAHSLHAFRDEGGVVRIIVGEMQQGGWFQPYNHDARIVELSTSDGGESWASRILSDGQGTFEAAIADVDGDGKLEIIGNVQSRICMMKERQAPLAGSHFRHRFLDWEKPWTGTEIISVDVDGDGRDDVVCGAWWYRNPGWERFEIPGIYQTIGALDVDGDGKKELIATKRKGGSDQFPVEPNLTTELYWLKPIVPQKGEWEVRPIGTGARGYGTPTWPTGCVCGPFLPGGRTCLALGYAGGATFVELFEIPDDPRMVPWRSTRLPAAGPADGGIVGWDMAGRGRMDIVAGGWWLENLGEGKWETHSIASDGFEMAEWTLADIDGDGRTDIVACESHPRPEAPDFSLRRLVWLRNPGDPCVQSWNMHTIDNLRTPRSVSAFDIDGDGHVEIICGEHNACMTYPSNGYRSRCSSFVYRNADGAGGVWVRSLLDNRFSHCRGTKPIKLGEGRIGIVSHDWYESRYVHLWEPAGSR